MASAAAVTRSLTIVQPAKVALAKAQVAIESTIGTEARANIVEAELCYLRTSDLTGTPTNKNDWVLSWHFLIAVDRSQLGREPVAEDYWTDAITGELLGHKGR
jgi:hypothetical protein